MKDVADAARTNLLGAEELRAAATVSWEELREAARLPEPGEDLRGRWLHELGRRIGRVRRRIWPRRSMRPGRG